MATRDIKTRFVLEGEQKFRSTMKQSAQAIKVLNSEQKLAAAQFKQSGDAEKYAAKQTEILKAKIEEQKAAVAAAEEAIRHLTENGVEQNSAKMQQWKIKLNEAQSALVKMETDLANVGAESADAANQTDELGDSLASLDKKASIDAVVKGVDKLTDGIGNALNKVKELATGLVDELKKAASWADDLTTQAMIFGYDRETLQRMQHAAKLVDTDVETIVSARQKLEKAMSSDSEDTLQAFAQLGIHTQRYGKYRDWEEVFWEAGDALLHMTDGLDATSAASAEIVRDNTAMAIFGKSWRELIPLFTAGRAGYQAAMDSAAVVSDEDIDKLTQLDDALVELQNEFEVLKTTVLAQLAPTLTELAGALERVFEEFNKYLQSEEGQAKLKELGEAVKGFFTELSNVDLTSAIETVRGAIDGIIEAMEWLKENGNTVIDIIKGLGIAWLGVKVAEGGAAVLQLVTGLKGLFGSGAAGAAGAAGAGAAKGIRSGIFAGAGAKLAGTSAHLANAANTIGPYAGAAVMGAMVIGDKTEFGRTLRDGGTLDDALKNSAKAFENWQREVEQNAKTFAEDWANVFSGGKSSEPEKPAPTPGATKEEMEAALADELAGLSPIQLKLKMQAMPEKPAGTESFWTNGGPVEVLKEEAEKDSPALDESMSIIGGNAAAGLAAGIDERADEVINAAKRLGGAVTSAFQQVLMVHSPSRVMEEIGEFVGLGFAQGINNEMDTVTRAAERMAGAAIISPGSGRGGNMVDVTLMIGPDRLAEILVPLVNDGLGEEIGLARR